MPTDGCFWHTRTRACASAAAPSTTWNARGARCTAHNALASIYTLLRCFMRARTGAEKNKQHLYSGAAPAMPFSGTALRADLAPGCCSAVNFQLRVEQHWPSLCWFIQRGQRRRNAACCRFWLGSYAAILNGMANNSASPPHNTGITHTAYCLRITLTHISASAGSINIDLNFLLTATLPLATAYAYHNLIPFFAFRAMTLHWRQALWFSGYTSPAPALSRCFTLPLRARRSRGAAAPRSHPRYHTHPYIQHFSPAQRA